MAALTFSHTEPAVGRQSLFQGYRRPAEAYDEAWAAPGLPRPHWERVVQMLDSLGMEELTRRWEQARRLIRENGVTYHVYGDPQGMHRPWELDAVPLVIAPEEWERLAAALVQRVQVLNAFVTDVYGPQTLLSTGLLPPELVFAHPAFLRPCHNVRVPRNHYVHLYAADLVHAPDAQWRVLADRTQSPAGAGYALENRLVLSRTRSDVFNEGQVERLAPFFDALRKTLISLAPAHRVHPRIDVLCEVSADGRRPHLEALLNRLHTDLPALSDAMTHRYLSHAASSRHLATSALASPQ